MELQTILFGTWMPPENVSTRAHRIGLWGQSRYASKQPRPRPKSDPNALTKSESKVVNFVEKWGKPISAGEVSEKLGIFPSHAGVLLGSAFKKEKLNRTLVRERGTRLYIYRSK